MSVLIKGMEMPKRCFDCDLYDDEEEFCKAQRKFMPMAVFGNYKNKNCPIVELPEKHGDLIDRDALPRDVMDFDVWNASVVIEAEGEEK